MRPKMNVDVFRPADPVVRALESGSAVATSADSSMRLTLFFSSLEDAHAFGSEIAEQASALITERQGRK